MNWSEFKLDWTSKDNIYKETDIISLHLPNNNLNKKMIRKEHLYQKKPDAILIDTSQYNLYEAKESEHVSGVAIDVFEYESEVPSEEYEIQSHRL